MVVFMRMAVAVIMSVRVAVAVIMSVRVAVAVIAVLVVRMIAALLTGVLFKAFMAVGLGVAGAMRPGGMAANGLACDAGRPRPACLAPAS